MNSKIDIQVRDILQSGADIIAFSAHPSLLAGSGVSSLLHRAAGPKLDVLAKTLGPITSDQSAITSALIQRFLL